MCEPLTEARVEGEQVRRMAGGRKNESHLGRSSLQEPRKMLMFILWEHDKVLKRYEQQEDHNDSCLDLIVQDSLVLKLWTYWSFTKWLLNRNLEVS